MDDVVRRAMAKWPDVPAVFGWLFLDLRGQWRIRDERISNQLLVEFIGRNYAADEQGRWFFQNGPQRVFVTLAYAPWILRIARQGELLTHTDRPVQSVRGAWMDRAGFVVLDTEHGAGIVHDRDVELLVRWLSHPAGTPLDDDRLTEALEHVQQGNERDLAFHYGGNCVPLLPIRAEEVPTRLRFVRDPARLPRGRGLP